MRINIKKSPNFDEKLRKNKKCRIFGLDHLTPQQSDIFEGFICCDLDQGLPRKTPKKFDEILMLDVLEHLSDPENFLFSLKEHFKYNQAIIIHTSTGNVAFFATRILHMLGMFNYGKKGILDITHKRLFTRQTFVNLFEQNGFKVRRIEPVPGPWQMLFGDGVIGKTLTSINTALCKMLPTIFAYQFFLTVEPNPHLDQLLKNAEAISKKKLLGVRKKKSRQKVA